MDLSPLIFALAMNRHYSIVTRSGKCCIQHPKEHNRPTSGPSRHASSHEYPFRVGLPPSSFRGSPRLLHELYLRKKRL